VQADPLRVLARAERLRLVGQRRRRSRAHRRGRAGLRARGSAAPATTAGNCQVSRRLLAHADEAHGAARQACVQALQAMAEATGDRQLMKAAQQI
jgi:hypothetical protein